MADNPLPFLRSNATQQEIVDWLTKEVYPRITQQSALKWGQVDSSDGSVDDLQPGSLGEHIADTDAHGASGDIVGVDDRPTSTVGGSVLLAGAVTDISLTAIVPGVAYSQTEVTNIANQVKAVADKLDALLAALRAAGVLET
jgi:hypothetical protein